VAPYYGKIRNNGFAVTFKGLEVVKNYRIIDAKVRIGAKIEDE